MLPRVLAIIFLLGSMVLAGKLIYDLTIFQFWTTPWVIGTLSTLVLISLGIALLFLNDEESGYLALSLFGILYCIAAIIIYVAWGFFHISSDLNSGSYFGFLMLFVVVTVVSMIGIGIPSEKGNTSTLFMLPAWGFALPNVVVIFAIVWKYVFATTQWIFWPFIGELFIAIVGALIFVVTYLIATKQ